MSETILIADDSLPVREAGQSALHARGSRVELACDGNQALARLREVPLDLLIADVHMPGLDGYSLCREVKAQHPATRVLLLVGTFEPFDAESARAARADGVVRKPFVSDELQRRVEDLLGPAAAAEPARGNDPAPAADPEAVVDPGPLEAVATPVPDQGAPTLSDSEVDRIARRVLALGGEAVLERVARELLSEAASERVSRCAAGAVDFGGDPERD